MVFLSSAGCAGDLALFLAPGDVALVQATFPGALVLWVVEPVQEELALVVLARLLVEVPELVVLLVDLGEGSLELNLVYLLHDGAGRLSRVVQRDPGLESALVVECWLAFRAVPLDLFPLNVVLRLTLWNV